MVKLTIDQIQVEVPEGTSVMKAAAILGINIPSMCFLQDHPNHPSCMVCLVRDLDHDRYIPSCTMPASEGMRIHTDSAEVKSARREALELLLSDHVGDCEAPCRRSCPAFMDIPLMNRLIASGDFAHALRIVREEIALPMVLGYICPAPCEMACRRKPIDQPVSICLLKRSTAQHETVDDQELPETAAKNGKKIAIIGTGPAGLSAAFYLQRSGHDCVLFDQHVKAGGTLRYDIPEERLPKELLDAEIGIIRQMGAEFRLGFRITGEYFQNKVLPWFDAVILATGNRAPDIPDTFGIRPDEHGRFADGKNFMTSARGIFACGNIIREQKMAVHSAAQGKLAAAKVAEFLSTKLPAGHRSMFHSVIGKIFEPEWKEFLKESIPDNRVEPSAGFNNGYTRDEAMHEAQRCMHCDCRKPASCKLRKYADEYHADRKRFSVPERNLVTRSFRHEELVYETEKCIRCGLCVAITEKLGETIGLTYVGRGFDVRISVPFNGTIHDAITTTAGECVDACPSGALAFKIREERIK